MHRLCALGVYKKLCTDAVAWRYGISCSCLDDLEALALLLVRHDGAAVLVWHVDALLLVGGAADAVEVGLAKLLVDHVVGGRADDLGAVPVVLSVGLGLLAITSATLAALVAVAVVLIALAHGAGEDRRREAKDEEVS